MADYTVDATLRLETRLNRSFALCVAFFVAIGVLQIVLTARGSPLRQLGPWPLLLLLLLLAGLLAAYIWFAIEITSTAVALGKKPALFLVWMIAAPFLALLPLPVISTIIAASPLSLKLLLAGQLRSEIHDRTSLH